MSGQEPDDLVVAMRGVAPPGVTTACRAIGPDEEHALLPAEADCLIGRAPRLRRQSAAARIAARSLLHERGFVDAAVRKSASGAPIWPTGIVGSLAHDDHVAVAAIASSCRFESLGIDVEPALPLPADIVRLVTTPTECARHSDCVVKSRILFAVKEAIFKALNPIDGVFLDFHDIEVDLDARRGTTRHGHRLEVAAITHPRVVAFAYRRMP